MDFSLMQQTLLIIVRLLQPQRPQTAQDISEARGYRPEDDPPILRFFLTFFISFPPFGVCPPGGGGLFDQERYFWSAYI